MADAWPEAFTYLSNYRLLVFAGLAKNAGKTTAVNAINSLFAREALGITSFGVDGEERDAVYRQPKPPVQVYAGQFLLTAERFLRDRQSEGGVSPRSNDAFEVLQQWGNHPQFGPWLIVRCRRDALVRLAGPSNLPELKEGIRRLAAAGAERIHLDGALGRLSHLSLTPAGVVLSTGAALGNSLEEVVRHTRRVLEFFRLPLANGSEWAAEARTAVGENAYAEGNSWHLLNGFLWTRNLRTVLPQGYEKLFLTGALTDRLYHELREAGRLPKAILLEHPGQILLSQPVWEGLQQRGITVVLTRRPDLLFLTLNPWHPLRPIPTEDLAAALQPYSHVPLVDVARRMIWQPCLSDHGGGGRHSE